MYILSMQDGLLLSNDVNSKGFGGVHVGPSRGDEKSQAKKSQSRSRASK